MKVLVVGYDVDLSEIKQQLDIEVSDNVFFKSITFPAASYDPNVLFEDVPKMIDAIIFTYSDAGHSSTQLRIYYGLVRSNFSAEKKYNYCLESFDEKHKLDKDITEINLEELKLMISAGKE